MALRAARGEMIYYPIKQAKRREQLGITHREWRIDDIRFLIKNDLYIGRLQYAVNAKSAYLRGLDPIYNYRQDLRILTDEVFERNQKIAAMRQRIPRNTKASPHLFSGTLRCPRCGDRMLGKRQVRERQSGPVVEYSYQCNRYNKSGPSACVGYILYERHISALVLPILVELLQQKLREHLQNTSAVNPLYVQMAGEINAELAKIDQGLKNLLEAVKQGALSMEQVKVENAELQDTKRRLEKRLRELSDSTTIADEVSAVMDLFDQDFEMVLSRLREDRLRFNTLVRVFFAALVIEVDRPGRGWKRGIKKGELRDFNPRLTKFAFTPPFDAFVNQSGLELPEGLKNAERQSYVYRCSRNGSPNLAVGYALGLEFFEAFKTLTGFFSNPGANTLAF